MPTFKRTPSTPLVGEMGEGDGLDPRYETRKKDSSSKLDKHDYAAQRLSHQIKDSLALSPELSTVPELEDFCVSEVLHLDQGNTYTVILYCTDPELVYKCQDIEELLKEQRGNFRREIARSINRKKVPELKFLVLPPGEQP